MNCDWWRITILIRCVWESIANVVDSGQTINFMIRVQNAIIRRIDIDCISSNESKLV